MKKRGLVSPDLADALALTFAYPVSSKGIRGKVMSHEWQVRNIIPPLTTVARTMENPEVESARMSERRRVAAI